MNQPKWRVFMAALADKSVFDQSALYVDFKGEEFRALRYPFLNHARDFSPRIFSMDETVDGEKVLFTASVDLNTVSLTKSRDIAAADLMSSHDMQSRQEGDRASAALYDLRCQTVYGNYDVKDVIPILAIGSNSSDEQLSRKFRLLDDCAPVCILPAWQENWAVSYVPLMVEYGSFAANYILAKGLSSRVTVGFYTLEQARHIILSEDAYDLCRLKDALDIDGVGTFNDALVFMNDAGCVSFDGGMSPALIHEVPHRGEVMEDYSSLTQRQLQEKIAATHWPDTIMSDFIRKNIEDTATRSAVNQKVLECYGMHIPYKDHVDVVLKGADITTGEKILKY
jgi:hypothetical protein